MTDSGHRCGEASCDCRFFTDDHTHAEHLQAAHDAFRKIDNAIEGRA